MSTPAPGFNGLSVAAFESRRAPEMARLIERLGGIPHVSPSLREGEIADNPEAVDFAHRVITGQVGIIIFTTGVGVPHLVADVEPPRARARFPPTVRVPPSL